jgi:hypothetical protein
MTESLSDDQRAQFRTGVIEPIAGQLKGLIAQGVDLYVGHQIMDAELARKAIQLKNLSYARGFLSGMTTASNALDQGTLAGILGGMTQAYDDPVFAQKVYSDTNQYRSSLAELISFPIPPIAEKFKLMLDAYRSGVVSTAKAIAEITEKYPEYEDTDLVNYYSGCYQGAVYCLDLLSEGKEEDLVNNLNSDFYQILAG